jgi:FMN phosphatase YigB (HAD superfamily)
MRGRFIDRFEVILLDQGRTFMFENDRFGPEQDYFQTYRQLGGVHLTSERLHDVMDSLVRHMMELGRNPLRYDSFPTVSEALGDVAAAAGLHPEDAAIIDELVALHEAGSISAGHANAIRCLAMTHRLGIVSYIWGRRRAFERNLAEAGILACFEHLVWSSEIGSIKPSAKIFRHALGLFNVPAAKVLFVGDHPLRDIAAAKLCGCATAWVQNGDEKFPEDSPSPDLTIHHMEELISAPLGQPAPTAPS